jgi:SulP family sulfate permease
MPVPNATWVNRVFPFLSWFPMTRDTLRADLLAGITVTLVLVPQSMAYAQLAGLPAYYGLYAAFLPVIIGALWGSSRQLATGPVAIVSLLTASALAPLAATGSEQYIALAIMLAFLVGAIQLALGLFRLGAVVNLLSHPVIMGFTNAAALIIGLSQLNKLLGVPMARSESFLADIAGVLRQVGDTHLPTLAMGLAALGLMVLLKRFAPKLPNVLIAVALATLVSWQIGFEREARVPLHAIQDPDLRALATDYSAAQERIAELEAASPKLRAQLQAAQGRNDVSAGELARLDYELMLTRLQHDELLKENRSRMQTLRRQSFALVGSEGHPVLQSAEKATADGRRWRIKKLTPDDVHLTGGGEVVGAIPSGLPSLSLPQLDWHGFTGLLSAALVISLVGFMEAVSIAKAMAAKTRSRIDPNQELIGQGLANVAGSMAQSFPTSGSFSRSAVNLNAGAVTGLASVLSGALVLLTLLFLTDLLYHLPQAVLAAVIMMAVAGLINIEGLRHAWKLHKHDGIAAVVTFAATLAFAPHLDKGILFGAAVAIALLLYRRMRPRAEVLGRDREGTLAGMEAHDLQPISEHYVPVRFDGELTFVNVAYFEDMVLEALARFPNARAILVVGSGINEMDASGEEKLRAIASRLKSMGVALYMSSLKQQVRTAFERGGLADVIPEDHVFKTKEAAMEALEARYGQSPAPAEGGGPRRGPETTPPLPRLTGSF